MGAVAGLAPPYLRGFLEGLLGDKTPETSAAQDVGPLTYDGRAGVLVYDKGFDTGYPGLAGYHQLARRTVGDSLGEQADVFRNGAAATAH